jgi:integrase
MKLMAEDALKSKDVTPGRYADHLAGLFLRVTESKAGVRGRFWEVRFATPDGGRASMSLGPVGHLAIDAARTEAARISGLVRQGRDPRVERLEAAERDKAKIAAAQAAKLASVTLDQLIKDWLPGHLRTLKSEKNVAQWKQHLQGGKRSEDYLASIRHKALKDISKHDVADVLRPLWHDKSETARRLGQKLEKLFTFAVARDYIDANPANPKVLTVLLGKRGTGKTVALPGGGRKVVERDNHAAMPYSTVPDFYRELCIREGTSSAALRLLILTAMRPGEVRSMEWDEIDLKEAVWTIPAIKMKMKKSHIVPLSPEAARVLNEFEDDEREGLVFTNTRGGMLSDMALTALLKRMRQAVTAHGFRSSFRDWAGDKTDFQREVAEAALAHAVGGVEGAYRRGDAFEKRRDLMNQWARYVTGAFQIDHASPTAAARANIRLIVEHRKEASS